MPALLDARMTAGLRSRGIPYGVIVHDGTAHPGEGFNFRLLGQARLIRDAKILFALSGHVAADLRRQGFGDAPAIVKLWHPPFDFGPLAPPPLDHIGPPRLLFLGRLLPYKGLDLLAEAVALLGPDLPFALRICGDGPNSPELAQLREMRGVTVERRWIPEGELAGLVAWADAVVLPYREASQSGVAAAAIAQGRYVLATNVGGLPEQLDGISGAVLCAPTGPAIAAGLAKIFSGPPPAPVDAAADWRAMAAALLAKIQPAESVTMIGR
jgi:glycosyltransferase involved in cell wall biosynthesis